MSRDIAELGEEYPKATLRGYDEGDIHKLKQRMSNSKRNKQGSI
jgi:hypothetical protein